MTTISSKKNNDSIPTILRMGGNFMKRAILTLILILGLAPLNFAVQDPRDPGIQDSLIVGETYIDSGTTFAFVRVYTVTDDSVAYYNAPLGWNAPGGGVYPGSGTQYFYPLTSWDLRYDSVMINEGYVRQFGISDLGDEDNPTLFTGGIRVNVWNLRFIVSPSAPPQMVVLDTTFDSVNRSLIFGLHDGVTEFPPAFIPGTLGISSPVERDITKLPDVFALEQNYPNPFNPTTIIEFSLPIESHALLIVYDLLGNRVKTLVDETQAPGIYSVVWDGTDDSGAPRASGTYFYRLSTTQNSLCRRMTLLR
jgi:hypothetical protein